jgi:DNA invertase Pin-like site-specific DNA recombinase
VDLNEDFFVHFSTQKPSFFQTTPTQITFSIFSFISNTKNWSTFSKSDKRAKQPFYGTVAMKFGYARVSTKEQNLDPQIDALEKEGCKTIYQEKISGAKADRPELRKMIDQLREGDVIVIWKLDRLGRSLHDLVNLITEIQDKGAGLKSLNDSIDTTTPQGKLTFHLFAALAEFERDIISERTRAGLEAARARGRKGGRPKGLSKEAQNKAIIAETLYKQGDMSVSEICKHLGIARSTLYNLLRFRGLKFGDSAK